MGNVRHRVRYSVGISFCYSFLQMAEGKTLPEKELGEVREDRL